MSAYATVSGLQLLKKSLKKGEFVNEVTAMCLLLPGNNSGELTVWSHRDGGGYPDVGKDIIVTQDGSIVAVGGNRSENPPYDDINKLPRRRSGGVLNPNAVVTQTAFVAWIRLASVSSALEHTAESPLSWHCLISSIRKTRSPTSSLPTSIS